MKLQDIHPNPKNPRFLRKEKSEWLEDSLNEFGDLSGYVFNKGGMIISAHQRWEKIKPKVKGVVIRETFKKPLSDGTIERGHFELNDGTKHDYSVRDWTPEKADRATIRANAQNAGEWDADILANQWEYEPEVLQDMGVPEWVFGEDGESEEINPDELGEGFALRDGDRAAFQQMTFTLADEQATEIKNAIGEMQRTDEYKYAETFGNENGNGNALYLIIREWVGQKILS